MGEFDNPRSVYSVSLKAVAEKEHKQVQKFQFQKQNKKNGQQLYKMTDVTTGTSVILSSASKVYDWHRQPDCNVWIWADTFEQVDVDAEAADVHERPKATVQKNAFSKQINRTLNLQQQKHILTEVVFGDQIHPTKKIKIEPFQRNQHGCQGHFYASVCAHLNSSSAESGPFKNAPATVERIKDFIEIGVNDRMKVLQEKYGEKFKERRDWDTFNDRPSADEDETVETILKAEINSLFDALVYGSFEPQRDSSSSESTIVGSAAYTGEDDETLANVVNAGGLKRKREHKLESVKPKSVNSIVQFEQRTSAITEMVKSLTAIMAQPESASIAPTGRPSATASLSDFDSELKPLLQSLLGLPKPPGTTAICEALAMGLGKYGIISLSELHEMKLEDAESILKGLNWSPMQIAKVLQPCQHVQPRA
jgi:hypothetical protein